MSEKELQLKFKAKDSSHFYTILLTKAEIDLFKSITHIDNHIVVYEKAEKQNKDYLKNVENSGKSYGNRDEAYYTLYDASKYLLGMDNIYNILDNLDVNYSGETECKLNGMHIYTGLNVIKIVYNNKADKLITMEHNYHNNSIVSTTYNDFVEDKNSRIEELQKIQKLDIKLREVVNPKELTISQLQFAKSELSDIDGICKSRPK